MRANSSLRVRRMPMEEILHVRVDSDGVLRARHGFAFCGVRFLILELLANDRGGEEHGMKVESEGRFVGPDEGRALPNPIGGRMVVKLRDGDTAGSFSVHDNVIPAIESVKARIVEPAPDRHAPSAPAARAASTIRGSCG